MDKRTPRLLGAGFRPHFPCKCGKNTWVACGVHGAGNTSFFAYSFKFLIMLKCFKSILFLLLNFFSYYYFYYETTEERQWAGVFMGKNWSPPVANQPLCGMRIESGFRVQHKQ